MRTYVALDPERTVTNQLSHAFVHYTHQPVDLNICGKWILAAFNRAGALQRKSHQHLAITSHQHLATSTWPSRHSQPVRAQMASALTPITTSLWGMQYSVHSVPASMVREVQSVFPDVDLAGMLVVPTCQQADYDLVRTGEKIDTEKDRLLERFMEWSRCVCDKLQDQGYWCDFIDPCSGLPMIQQGTNNVYPEVEGLSLLLGFKTQNAGCCKIVLHPRWGSAVYPATLFTKAPLAQLVEAIKEAEALLQGTGLSQP